MKVATRQQVYELEEDARKILSVNSPTLMTQAAKQLAKFIYQHIQERASLQNLPLVFFCGKGNNGGDGIATALFLAQDFGIKNITIYSLAKAIEFSSEIANFYQQLKKYQIEFYSINKIDELQNFPSKCVIIDGLLGIGFQGSCKPDMREFINFINLQEAFTISIDLPSGLNADDGTTDIMVKSDLTFTLGVPKAGLFMNSGAINSGMIEFLDINLDLNKLDSQTKYPFTTFVYLECQKYFKRKNPNSYKNTQGQLFIIAGSKSYSGAALLSTNGALSVGVGMLYLALKSRPFANIPPSVIICDCINPNEETFSHDDLNKILPIAKKVDTILIGPGLQQNAETQTILGNLIELPKRLIIDADAINLIANYPEVWKLHQCDAIFTPHIGEAERLKKAFGINTPSENRLELAKALAIKLGATVILKGRQTVIASPNADTPSVILGSGSYTLGKGGSGDILSGVLAALASRMMETSLFEIAQLGAFLHSYSVHKVDSMSSFNIDKLPQLIHEEICKISPF